MRRLRTLAILLSLGAASRPAFGEGPDAPGPEARPETPSGPAAPDATPANRPEPPAAPKKYLETGALLFNRQRYDLAAKYLEAAQMYRDRLTPNEQIVLDEFRDQLDQHVRARTLARVAPAPAAEDPGVVTASTVGARPLDMSGRRADSIPDVPAAGTPGDPAAGPASAEPSADTPKPAQPLRGSSESLRGTSDTKQRARWMLHQARERILLKQYDAASQIVAEVRGLNVQWGYFDDTPDKVTESIAKLRARAGSSPGAEKALAHDRRSARAKLREARAALAVNDVEGADSVVREVKSWGLRYGLLEDTPDKVAAAVEEARRGRP